MPQAHFKKVLILQTAFLGDVILATVLIEKIKAFYPDCQIDFLLRKGNESLLLGHPHLNRLLIWDKKHKKRKNMFRLIREIRQNRYDVMINVQRFSSSGLMTAFSGARYKIGFDKNPFAFLYHQKTPHSFDAGKHEVERNLALIEAWTDGQIIPPRLYPQAQDYAQIAAYLKDPYITIAPTSVWFTKQFAREQWIAFLDQLPDDYKVYLLGAPGDQAACAFIAGNSKNKQVNNLAGTLSLLQSAALMEKARMNYVNDSAPMHLASARNAPTTVVYCSTIPAFGFGPLADDSHIIEIEEPLACRPCGIHGHPACPIGHFRCSSDIKVEKLLEVLA